MVNPIGSQDPADFKVNVGNLDKAMNDQASQSWTDRFGVDRLTWFGIETKTNDAINGLAFQIPVDYAAGLNVNTKGFTVTYSGVVYATQPSAVPFTTGAWDAAQWYPIQNVLNQKNLLVFDTYAEASAAAATLPDGQRVVSEYDEVRGVVNAGSIDQEQSIYAAVDYAKIRSYTGRGTRLRVYDPTGAHWWVRRGTSADNDGTVLKDAIGRSWEREYHGPIFASWFSIDESSDNTIKLANLLTNLNDGDCLDFNGMNVPVFNTVTGVTSGDATPLSLVPRLFNKKNITLKNGCVFAKNQSVSPTKLRYPTTLTIDGCEDITLEDFSAYSKGENYGDVDASEPLGFEERRTFAAQNGGHALLICRSKGTKVKGGKYLRAGSCGTVYSMSSSGTVMYGSFSSPQSLGYAAYACDSWAGGTDVSGFEKHDTHLIVCNTDAHGAEFGSKGCVVAEDPSVEVHVFGGSYKDAYANGAATWLGSAFIANTAKVYVDSAFVENCAAVSGTLHSADYLAEVICNNVVARKLRTSAHIQAPGAFGESRVTHNNPDYEITGTSLWPDVPELSKPTIVANLKTSSVIDVDFFGGRTVGADTFSINTQMCYGGILISGGIHKIANRLFDSAGWGGSTKGSSRGYELKSGAKIIISNGGSTAITQSKTDAIVIKNFDAAYRVSYKHLVIDDSVVFHNEGITSLSLLAEEISSPSLLDERVVSPRITGMLYMRSKAGVTTNSRVSVYSLDGLALDNVIVTFKLINKKPIDDALVFDDNGFSRKVVGVFGEPYFSENEYYQKVYLKGDSYNLTVGSEYPALCQ